MLSSRGTQCMRNAARRRSTFRSVGRSPNERSPHVDRFGRAYVQLRTTETPMSKKVKLTLDDLQVESFVTGADPGALGTGTVHGQATENTNCQQNTCASCDCPMDAFYHAECDTSTGCYGTSGGNTCGGPTCCSACDPWTPMTWCQVTCPTCGDTSFFSCDGCQTCAHNSSICYG